MRNEDDIKWKFIKFPPKDQVADRPKSIKEAIQYTVDEPKFIEDWNLAYLDYWMNKAKCGVFNLKQSVDNVFPFPKAIDVVILKQRKCGHWLRGGNSRPKGFPRQPIKECLGRNIRWRKDQGHLAHANYYELPMRKGGHYQEKNGGYGEINKVKVVGDERLLPYITCSQNTPKITNLQATQI